MCLPSHLPSSSVRCATHTSYTKRKSILCLILLSSTPSPLLSCLPSHLPSSSVRCAIHAYYIQKNGILFLILVPSTPSPLLSYLPSHLSSSSVRCAIHTSYMKRNSIVIFFSSHPTPLSLSNHPPLVTTLWIENYKSAKCNIAFDRELKWLLAPFFFMISFHNLKTLAAVY